MEPQSTSSCAGFCERDADAFPVSSFRKATSQKCSKQTGREVVLHAACLSTSIARRCRRADCQKKVLCGFAFTCEQTRYNASHYCATSEICLDAILDSCASVKTEADYSVIHPVITHPHYDFIVRCISALLALLCIIILFFTLGYSSRCPTAGLG